MDDNMDVASPEHGGAVGGAGGGEPEGVVVVR